MNEHKQFALRGPGRRLLWRVAKVLALTLCVVEVVFRLFLGNLGEPLIDAPAADGRCMALRPGTVADYTGYLLKVPLVRHDVNALGYRGPPRPVAKPPQAFRILLIGDSFTYGHGVEANQAIAAQLEPLLAARMGRPVEVLNFGIPGLNLESSVDQYRLFAAKWQHDMVIYLFFDNDFEPPSCREMASPKFLWMMKHVYAFRGVAALLWPWMFPSDFDVAGTQRRTQAGLRAFAERSRTAGAQLGVVLLGGGHTAKTRQEVRNLAAQLHFATFDVFQQCRQHIPEIPYEYHYTVEGNGIVANCLASWLTPAAAPGGAISQPTSPPSADPR